MDLSKLSDPQKQVVLRVEGNTLVLAGAGSGKALPMYAKILTPQGYIRMDQVSEGRLLIDALGNVTSVVGVFPQGERPCYTIKFDDGTSFELSDNHINRVYINGSSEHRDIETLELKSMFESGDVVDFAMVDLPLGYNNDPLLIDPWLLGVLLGNFELHLDSVEVCKLNAELHERVRELSKSMGYELVIDKDNYCKLVCIDERYTLHAAIRRLNLSNDFYWNYHIPRRYLLAPKKDRIELLKGLCDARCELTSSGFVFNTVSVQLSTDFGFLARSLGVKVYAYDGRNSFAAYTHKIECLEGFEPFTLSEFKNSEEIKSKLYVSKLYRRIESFDFLDNIECQCIKVDSPDETFITDNMIPTHNTHAVTHKIGYLMSKGVSPDSILAVTFTTKAAREMLERVSNYMPDVLSQGLTIKTFHSFCMQVLTRHGRVLNLGNFRILDTSEKLKIFKSILSNYDKTIAEKASAISGIISMYKNNLVTSWENMSSLTKDDKKLYQAANAIYPIYCNYCNNLSPKLLDFDDLLLKVLELFETNENVRNYYRGKIQHMLIDEYQDQNLIQEKITELLVLDNEGISLTCVGDDDQSIYGFRNAVIDYILNFAEKYNAVRINLEQNYRCPSNVVKLGSDILKPNPNRLEKNVFSKKFSEHEIQVVRCENGFGEAEFVAKEIDKLRSQQVPLSSIAILYRTNAQSFNFEKSLMGLGIPCKINKGLRFVDRREVRDTFAFLRCMFTDTDDLSFERIMNVPPRGLGITSQNNLSNFSMLNGFSLQQSATKEGNSLPASALKKVTDFVNLLSSYGERLQNESVYEYANVYLQFLNDIDYFSVFKNEGEREDAAKENITEIFAAYTGYYDGTPDEDRLPFLNFLSELALDNTEISDNNVEESVVLSTVHGVKGLEYDTVFLTGFEEGKFPHFRCLTDLAKQEERRLAYVAVTRASNRLFISLAKERQQAWGTSGVDPSGFLDDVTPNLYVSKKYIGSQRGSYGRK